MRAMPRRRWITPSLALATLVLTGPARANGRFPAASQLVVDPTDASHLVVRTTFGTLHSADAGRHFGWVCEQSVGYGGVEDPMLGVLAGGTMVAGVFDGLSVSRDRGCDWKFEGGVLADQYVTDVVVQKDDPTRALVVTSSGVDGGFDTRLVETTDSGASWHQAGVALGADFLALTVEVAKSDPRRVYVSGLVGSPQQGFVARSDDRGATWTRLPIDLQGAAGAYLAAVDPANPDRVYARLDGDPGDQLVVSDDGAATWRSVHTSRSDMLGFALSPDGAKVAIGGPKDGVLLASSASLAFAAQSEVGATCLTWTEAGLYGCAIEGIDRFTIGLSSDDGKSWTPIHHLTDTCPLACSAGTSTAVQCAESVWGATQQTLGQDPAACTGGGAATPEPPPSSDGGCAVGGPAGEGAGVLAMLAGLAFAARARRRGR